jgi:hypothetical protein
MAITGLGFKKRFEERVDKSYNDYYSNAQYNEFFARTLIQAAIAKYEQLDNQKRFDELRGLLVKDRQVSATSGRVALQNTVVSDFNDSTGVITTYYPHNALLGQTITVNLTGTTGTYQADVVVSGITEFTITVPPQVIGTFESGFVVTPQTVNNYLHLFSAKATYKVLSKDIIETVTATPQRVIIEFAMRSKLRNGDSITIENVLGTTSMNGTFYVNQVKPKKYQLYVDSDLETPLTANAAYISGGDVFQTIENLCFESKPDTQIIQAIDKPTFEFPQFQISDNALILLPQSGVQSVKLSYLKLPPINVNVENNKTDLSLFYTNEFIYFWIDMSARIFDLNTRNIQALNMDNPQITATI